MEISDFGIHFTTGDLNRYQKRKLSDGNIRFWEIHFTTGDLNGNKKRKLKLCSFRFIFPLRSSLTLRSPVVKCIPKSEISIGTFSFIPIYRISQAACAHARAHAARACAARPRVRARHWRDTPRACAAPVHRPRRYHAPRRHPSPRRRHAPDQRHHMPHAASTHLAALAPHMPCRHPSPHRRHARAASAAPHAASTLLAAPARG